MNTSMHRKMARPICQALLGLILTTLLVSGVSGTGNPELDCSSLVDFKSEVPPSAVSTSDLNICGTGLTCCTPEMEEEMMKALERHFIRGLQSRVKELSKNFDKAHQKLVKQFEDQVELGRNKGNDAFRRIYGILTNSIDLHPLYDHISSFYKSGYDQNLMTDYFNKLLFIIFEKYNVQYTFDDEYKRCVYTNDLLRSSSVKKQIRIIQANIKHSVTAVRAYTKGLLVGRDAIRSLMWFEPDEDCVKETVRMFGCARCSGNQGSPICADYCSEIYDTCFAKHKSFPRTWAGYYDAMHSLQKDLEHKFSVDVMMDSLYIHVSDVIMSFQEKAHDLSNEVFHTCGSPTLARGGWSSSRRTKRDSFFRNRREAEALEISKLIKGIQKKLKTANVDLCKDKEVSELNCWNGTAVGNYTLDISRESGSDGVTPSDVRSDEADLQPDPDAIYLLLATKKLRAASLGQDVEWLDYERKIFEICRVET